MQQYTNSEIERQISENVHNDMHRRILRMKFVDGKTFEQIGEAVDRTPRQIQNIVGKYRSMFVSESKIYTEICFS